MLGNAAICEVAICEELILSSSFQVPEICFDLPERQPRFDAPYRLNRYDADEMSNKSDCPLRYTGFDLPDLSKTSDAWIR